MNPRFDVLRKQDKHFIKWVGTVDRFEDVGKLMQADSESAKTPEDEYFVVHSAFGTTEGPLFETAMVQSR